MVVVSDNDSDVLEYTKEWMAKVKVKVRVYFL